MARITLVYRPLHPEANENGMVEKSLALESDYFNFPDNRAMIGNQSPSISVISDTMEHTRHMANGKYYDSKSEFRKATRAAGCVEVGNETKSLLTPRKPIELSRHERRDNIRKAIYDIRNK